MIPKIIHYCWFGKGEKSELVKRCIQSWKKHLPDYEIVEWNEDNFDVNMCKYTEQAYAAKKWAFVSDYARLYALYEYGGIYLDTDMELFQSLNPYLDNRFFAGFESNDIVACGVIGAEPKNDIIRDLRDIYHKKTFVVSNRACDNVANPHILTPLLSQYGLVLNGKTQQNGQIGIYERDIFYPNSLSMIFERYPKKAVSTHYGEKSWNNGKIRTDLYFRVRRYIVGIVRNVIGTSKLESIRDRK